MSLHVIKADAKLQIVYGWAGQYTRADGGLLVDSDGDMITPDEIEKASYSYLLEKRESGVMHEGKSVGQIVASLVTTPDICKAFGLSDDLPVGWIIGVRYPDQSVFKRVASGELAMFSIQGHADRVDQ